MDDKCPICSNKSFEYAFQQEGLLVYGCTKCTLTKCAATVESSSTDSDLNTNMEVCDLLLEKLEGIGPNESILVVATQNDPTANRLREKYNSIVTIIDPSELEKNNYNTGYSVAVLLSQLQQLQNPVDTLKQIRRSIKIDGKLFILTPLLDSRQAKILGRKWHGWRSQHLWQFTRDTLHLLCLRSGFNNVWFRRDNRKYNIDQVRNWLSNREKSLMKHIVEAIYSLTPKCLINKKIFPLPSSKTLVTMHVSPKKDREVLSIIVPVYNERKTFSTLMNKLLQHNALGLRKEIILVESNSTDGTRDLVMKHKGNPDVKIILQNRPLGKGNAVRAGIEAATGDFLIIQDGDLEYDLGDYELLLKPLVNWESMFVLGSRHRGEWKMREFNNEPISAAVFNLGHIFFTGILNILLGKRMTDPFTMFKVLRRDALFGLRFECNRFDFDHELVIKLVRKGYNPLEIPVNYHARSFAEGKKVSLIRDGLTWLWIDLKYRFAPLGQEKH